MTTIIEIVADYLRSIGADGLVQPDAECGCELGELRPCGDDISQCQPGWRGVDHAGGADWAMYTSREAAQASKAMGQEGTA